MVYRGYYNGGEYVPSDGVGNGGRNIRAVVWICPLRPYDVMTGGGEAREETSPTKRLVAKGL